MGEQNKRQLPIGGLSRMLEGQATIPSGIDATSETIVRIDVRKDDEFCSRTDREATLRKDRDAILQMNTPVGFMAKFSQGEVTGVLTLVEGSLENVPRNRTKDILDESMLLAKTLVSNAVIVHTTAGSKSEGHFRAKAIVHNPRNSTDSCLSLISDNSVGATRHKRAAKNVDGKIPATGERSPSSPILQLREFT